MEHTSDGRLNHRRGKKPAEMGSFARTGLLNVPLERLVVDCPLGLGVAVQCHLLSAAPIISIAVPTTPDAIPVDPDAFEYCSPRVNQLKIAREH